MYTKKYIYLYREGNKLREECHWPGLGVGPNGDSLRMQVTGLGFFLRWWESLARPPLTLKWTPDDAKKC